MTPSGSFLFFAKELLRPVIQPHLGVKAQNLEEHFGDRHEKTSLALKFTMKNTLLTRVFHGASFLSLHQPLWCLVLSQ